MSGMVREAMSALALQVMSAARWGRPTTRAAEQARRDGLHFRREADRWDEDRKREWMLDRLRRVVRAAARETPFWRDRFQAAGFDPNRAFSFSEFAALPPLEREVAAAAREAMISPRVPPSLRRRDATGGSTGVPLEYISGPEERGWRLSGQEWFFERIGIGPASAMAYVWGHHIDQRERTEWRQRVRDAVTARRWFDCFRLSPDVLLSYHEELSRFRPVGLVAYASALDGLARVLAERGLRAAYPSRAVITGAEKLWAHQRVHVEAVFRAPVFERYGSRELGVVAMQLTPGDPAFVVDWANLFVEPADDSADGSALLVTKLRADTMPMIRYRVGDVARFPKGSGPGTPVFALDEVIGRQSDHLCLPDGRWLHSVGIAHLMKDMPVREFQLVQAADYSVEVRVIPSPAFTDADGKRILAILRGNLPGIAITLVRVEEIARTRANKWRPVVSAVREAAAMRTSA